MRYGVKAFTDHWPEGAAEKATQWFVDNDGIAHVWTTAAVGLGDGYTLFVTYKQLDDAVSDTYDPLAAMATTDAMRGMR